jgi:hypothetical protein
MSMLNPNLKACLPNHCGWTNFANFQIRSLPNPWFHFKEVEFIAQHHLYEFFVVADEFGLLAYS